MVSLDEIDVNQILLGIWARKVLVCIVIFISVVFSIMYALSLDKKFKATAIINLDSQKPSPSIASSLTGHPALASLTMGIAPSSSTDLIDRATGRDFVLKLDEKVDLRSDPFFNPSNVKKENRLPTLGNLIANFIIQENNKTSASLNNDLVALDKVFRTYRLNVSLVEAASKSIRAASSGAITIDVIHTAPNRASVIANAIVKELSDQLQYEDNKSKKDHLTYLSENLATALKDMNEAKQSLANFALAKGFTSSVEFAQRSQTMAELRGNLEKTQELQGGASALLKLITQLGVPSTKDYQNIRAAFPILDQVEFRRLLGMPEAVNAWEPPSTNKLANTLRGLESRSTAIKINLNQLRAEAEKNANIAKQFEELQRQEWITSASYQVMLEQVKASSLKAGFETEKIKVYQTASPPIQAFEPKRKSIVIFGSLLGAFVACLLAITINIFKGSLFSRHSIANALSTSSNKVFKVSSKIRRDVTKEFRAISNSELLEFSELEFEIRKTPSRLMLVSPIGKDLTALPFALALAQKKYHLANQEDGKSTAIILLGQQNTKGIAFISSEEPDLKLADWENVTFYAPKEDVDTPSLLTSPNFNNFITSRISRRHDWVLIVTSFEAITIAASALVEHDPITVAITRPGKTTKKALATATQNIKWQFNVSLSN